MNNKCYVCFVLSLATNFIVSLIFMVHIISSFIGESADRAKMEVSQQLGCRGGWVIVCGWRCWGEKVVVCCVDAFVFNSCFLNLTQLIACNLGGWGGRGMWLLWWVIICSICFNFGSYADFPYPDNVSLRGGGGVPILTAKLVKCPKTLHLLWQEYILGFSGHKPAKEFTREERRKDWHTVHCRAGNWKNIWRIQEHVRHQDNQCHN